MGNNIDLIEKPEYILKRLQEHKGKIPFPYNELAGIFAIKKLTDYQFKGVEFKLIEYRGRLKSKKEVKFYGYATSKKNKKFLSRWLFLNYLYSHNFSSVPLLVPKPIILFHGLNFFLREEAKGKALFEYVKKKKIPELKNGARKSGLWLAKLRNLKIENQKIFNSIAAIEEKEFKHYLEVAKKSLFPVTYQKTKKFLDSIQEHTKSYLAKGRHLSLVHGDFQITNIIYDERTKNISAVDFDWSGIGDPLCDVGNFLVQFDYHSAPVLKEKEIISLKNEFLKNCFDTKSFNEFAERINLYQAKFAIQRAIFNTEFTLPPSQQPEKNSTIKFLLQKAEQCYQNKKNINLKVYPYQ